MTSIHRSALVEYSARQMFDLVNDIERYPEFLPGCKAARVISETDDEMLGELSLKKAGLSQRFVTRNCLERPRAITMTLEQGDFSEFSACWEFQALSASACKVTFTMEFQFKSGLVNLAADKLFGSLANGQVDAMVARAKQLYG